MSRHTVPALAHDHSVVVGWDRPMGTFFAHVRNLALDEDDQIIVWIGGHFNEVTTAAALVEAIRPHAVIPDELRAVLEAEQSGAA